MTVNNWIDIHSKLIGTRKIRLLNVATHTSYSDLFLYMDREVKQVKITSRFIFIFIDTDN